MCVCVCVCVYIHIYIYTYIYMYIYIYTYIYICHGGEYKYCGNRYISISYGIFMFLQENTFITPLLIVSLHCVIDDVIGHHKPCLKL